ncbi:MAG: T9SS type A sorting domain-containing protein [Bacteroidetes bacterium]|nr:T9SS type A sorting domain-containing protein [Bacteroidota bacterium]
MKKLATLIMLLILFSGYAKAETEPNDTWDLANTVLLGQTETGTAGLAQEDDWWTVSIPDDGTLTLSWTSLNGNYIHCQIYDTLGVLQFASSYTGTTNSINATGLAAGYYYIKLYSYYTSQVTSYSFTPTFTAVSVPNDPATNDVYTQATLLALNDSVTGHIGYYHNLYDDLNDWWAVTVNLDGRLDFTITSLNSQNVYALLYDGDGTTILAGSYTTTTNTYSEDGLAPGTYYILVKTFYPQEFAPYKLKNNLVLPPNTTESGISNDFALNATNINLNDSINGHIGYRYNGNDDLRDWYKFTTTEDGHIFIKLDVFNGQNVFAQIFDGDTVSILTGSYTTTGATYSINGKAAGTYYVRVRNFYDSEWAPYAIRLNLVPTVPDDPENNNTPATAVVMNPGDSVTGHIGYTYMSYDDVNDWYQVTTNADGEIVFKIHSLNTQNVYAELFDNDGVTDLAGSYTTTTATFNKNGLAAGTYFIRVKTYYLSEFAPYDLTVNLNVAPLANDAELNDSVEIALPLPVNTSVTGHIGYFYNDYDDLNDYYALTLPVDGKLTVTIDPELGQYTYATLLDNNGTTVLFNGYSNSILSQTANDLAAGTYYIRIRNYYAYEFTPYTLTTSLEPMNFPAEDAANNDIPTTATLLPANTAKSGHLNFYYNLDKDNIDWWVIGYDGSGAMTINAAIEQNHFNTAYPTFNYRLYADTNATHISSGAWTGPALNSLNLTGLSAGNYYLRLLPAFSTFGAYELTAQYTENCANVVSITSSSQLPGCLGTIDYSVSGGLAPYTVQLYKDNIAYGTPQVTNSAITFSSLPTGTYYARSYSFGASGTCNNVSANTVFSTPPVPSITAGGPLSFCQGGSVQLSSDAAASYLWSTGEVTQSIIVSSGGSYSVTVYNAAGCFENSLPVNVTVFTNPATPTITPLSTTICQGATTTLSASTANAYLWSTGETSQNIVTGTAGSYTVTVYDINNCSATSLASTVSVNPLLTWYADNDGDNFGNPTSSVQDCNQPSGYVADNTDCDDLNIFVYPGAAEQCNAIDDDCDGQTDEGCSTFTYYQDSDGDTYGNPSVSVTIVSPTPPVGYVGNNTDCNDGNAAINPGVAEICNSIDDNCNGLTDDGLTFLTYYIDADADGYGSSALSQTTCDGAPSGYVNNSTDCNDANNTINPGTIEICNSIDDNCDGTTDEGCGTYTYYADADGDSYGDATQFITGSNPTPPSGYVTNSDDCNDSNAAINPAAIEICNTIDDDCNGLTDDGLTFITYFADADGDGYGNGAIYIDACSPPAGSYVFNNNDCNDGNAAVNPAATEICNELDDNCSGTIDEGLTITTYFADADNDGYGDGNVYVDSCLAPNWNYVFNNDDCDDSNAAINPLATEICNGLDDNCDGLTDDGCTGCPAPGPISGPAQMCAPTGQQITYSIAAIPGATSYNWTVPAGTIILSGQGSNTLVVKWPFSVIHSGLSGDICVSYTAACGISTPSCLSIALQLSKPVRPASISGSNKACAGDNFVYSVALVSRATNYTWTVPAGATIQGGQGTNIITVLYDANFLGGDISVIASNGCGNSPERIRSISRNILKAPLSINGLNKGVCGALGVGYTCAAVPGAVSYQWSVPAGASIASGQGTSTITVDYSGAFTGGTISVYAINSCGGGATRTLSVIGAPAIPGTISGSTITCANQLYTYEVQALTGATAYTWIVPSFVQILSGQGTKTLNVMMGFNPVSSFTISVKASNGCGSSSLRKLENISTSVCPRIGSGTAFSTLQVYPNPASENLFVAITLDADQQIDMNLSDVTGRQVLQRSISGTEGENLIPVNISHLASGIYTMNIRGRNASETIRIILE